jgi:uncharacterized metal-binding protein YceD (DUF177 family)
MKLHIVAGTDGEWTTRKTVTPSSLELPSDPAFGDIDVTIVAKQTDRQIRVEIDAEATVSTDCYKCGEPYSFPLSAGMTLRLMRVANPERDSGDDELKFIGLSENDVDLTQDLRDLLALSLPMRLVCCEKD